MPKNCGHQRGAENRLIWPNKGEGNQLRRYSCTARMNNRHVLSASRDSKNEKETGKPAKERCLEKAIAKELWTAKTCLTIGGDGKNKKRKKETSSGKTAAMKACKCEREGRY